MEARAATAVALALRQTPWKSWITTITRYQVALDIQLQCKSEPHVK